VPRLAPPQVYVRSPLVIEGPPAGEKFEVPLTVKAAERSLNVPCKTTSADPVPRFDRQGYFELLAGRRAPRSRVAPDVHLWGRQSSTACSGTQTANTSRETRWCLSGPPRVWAQVVRAPIRDDHA